MTDTQHQTTVSLSERDRHAADWRAAGWQIVSIATFRSEGQRRAALSDQPRQHMPEGEHGDDQPRNQE